MVGHCLRYWPHYVKAREILHSGEFGAAVYASLSRSSFAPMWSGTNWYMQSAASGGVLDMHIHDIDIALWWFGEPASISTTGYAPYGLAMMIDSTWRYGTGLTAHLHAGWDRNGGGNGLVTGNIVIAPYNAASLTCSPQTTACFLPPQYYISGGGSSDVVFSELGAAFDGTSAATDFVQGVAEK